MFIPVYQGVGGDMAYKLRLGWFRPGEGNKEFSRPSRRAFGTRRSGGPGGAAAEQWRE